MSERLAAYLRDEAPAACRADCRPDHRPRRVSLTLPPNEDGPHLSCAPSATEPGARFRSHPGGSSTGSRHRGVEIHAVLDGRRSLEDILMERILES